MNRRGVLLTTLAAFVWLAVLTSSQGPADERIVLITLDGARIEEVFGGLDATAYQSSLREKQKLEDQAAYRRYWAATPEGRREKLMPFFWRTLMTSHGSIAGNKRAGSSVTLTNRHRFSYPGYAEILLGEAHDDVIKSNDAIQNPYSTVLEGLKRHMGAAVPQAAVFASWNVFRAIVERTPGALTVNVGFEPFEHPDPQVRALSELQRQTQTPWDSVRHDAYTFRFAMAHMKSARPRVLYLALGETDDWAHDGRYDRLLDAYARTDAYLEELWTWLQSQPDYRDRTHILISTDHGRGRTAEDWRNHGEKIEGAEDVWIALISPRLSQRGEWRDHAPLHTNQIAATLAGWAGMDWLAERPSAGKPIATVGSR